jgi:hypothetical protein
MGLDPRELANGLLTEYCNNSPEFGVTGRTGGMLSMIDSQQLLTYDNLTTAGSFSDMDVSPTHRLRMRSGLPCFCLTHIVFGACRQMLEVCNDGLSIAAQRSQFAIWSIMTSPLILGNVRPPSTTQQSACEPLNLTDRADRTRAT